MSEMRGEAAQRLAKTLGRERQYSFIQFRLNINYIHFRLNGSSTPSVRAAVSPLSGFFFFFFFFIFFFFTRGESGLKSSTCYS